MPIFANHPTAVFQSSLSTFALTLAGLMQRRDLDDAAMERVMEEMIAGRFDDSECAAFLVALRMKGESAGEIAAAVGALRRHMVRLDTGRANVLDTCGTGGDGSHTFNISTATALVAAGAGVPVVKHGNRAMSSQSGSADVLAALGVVVECDAAMARRCLDRAGLAFCFAPKFHPGLAHVAGVRRRLGVRTLFNCLGPLANPPAAAYQLIGVGQSELLDPLAGALARLGIGRALLVCSRDGLDEVSLSAPTLVRQVRGHEVESWEWTPQDFGVEPCRLEELQVASPVESAARIRAILDGQDGPATRIVLVNAAAALLAAEHVQTVREGIKAAGDAIATGRARQVLEGLVACSRER